MHAVTKRLGSFRNPAREDNNPNRLERMPQESEKQERKAAEKETRRPNTAQAGSNRALLVLVITMCLISLVVLVLTLLMLFGKIGNGSGCSKDEGTEASSTKSAQRTDLEEDNTSFHLGLKQRLDKIEEFTLKADARYNDLREDLNMTRSEMLLMTDNITLTSRLEYHDTVLSQLKSALNKTSTDLAELKSTQTKERVIYHQTMTPFWLEAHALYINSQHSSTAEQLTFNAGSVDNAVLLTVPLLPANVLQNSSMLTVRIVVSNDVSIGTNEDSDILYYLTDRISYVGFFVRDKRHYHDHVPCFGVEHPPGRAISHLSPRPSDTFYPGQFVFTFKLDERENWGSCYTAHDGGFLKTAGYSRRLDPSKGLTLEVYLRHKRQRAGIKFIEVTIVDDI